MVEIPWYVEHYRVFLIVSLLAVVLLLAPYFSDGVAPYMGYWVYRVESSEFQIFFDAFFLLLGIFGYIFFKVFQRYWEVVDALGYRLVSVEVVDFFRTRTSTARPMTADRSTSTTTAGTSIHLLSTGCGSTCPTS